LFWQGRYDDQIRFAEEGLALLGDDRESAETALMNQELAVANANKGNRQAYRDFTYRTAQFLRNVPYSRELRPAYEHVIGAYLDYNNVAAASEWLHELERRATAHDDRTALGKVYLTRGEILANTGDGQTAIGWCQQALELFIEIEDIKYETWSHRNLSLIFWRLGYQSRARAHAAKAVDRAKSSGARRDMAMSLMSSSAVMLSEGAWQEASNALQQALQLYQEIYDPRSGSQANYLLGRVFLAQGHREEALEQFQRSAESAFSGALDWRPRTRAEALSGIEEAYADPAAFHAWFTRFRAEHPEVSDLPFAQWYLKPAPGTIAPAPPLLGDRSAVQEPLARRAGVTGGPSLHRDDFATELVPDWTWVDPLGDSSYVVRDGIEIHAANGRDLWYINVSAPRILRSASGDLVVQATCAPVGGEKPTIGGLLLWKDRENYLGLTRGLAGAYEITFTGHIDNKDLVFGRGQLGTGDLQRVFLRLERAGNYVQAFCSADGVEWFTVGHTVFPVEDPIRVGLHAIGHIEREIYHGPYPEGTAIRFETFWLWTG
jgi:tetratricopeptide (TPR) repeat protein